MTSVEIPISINRPVLTAGHGFSLGFVHPDRIVDFHDMVYIVDGGWEICENKTRHTLGPGDMVFLYRGLHHYGLKPCEPRTRWIYIHFEEHPADRFHLSRTQLSKTESSTKVMLDSFIPTYSHPHIHELLREIVRCRQSSSHLSHLQANALLTELFIELARVSLREQPVNYPSAIDKAICHIESHPDETFSIDVLAELTSMSRRSFTRQFRGATGKSVKQFQLERKIQLACACFRYNRDAKVKEIAYMLGFCDEYHFSRVFKQVTGYRPSENIGTRD